MKVLFIALAISVVFTLSLVGTSVAAEPSEPDDGLYIILSGGSHIHYEGIDDGARPAVQLGFGYYWKWFSIDADFLWSNLEWDRGVICFAWDVCDPEQFHGNLFGGIVQVRIYLLPNYIRLRPFFVGGAGGQVVSFQDDGENHRAWGLTWSVGGGLGIRIIPRLSIYLSMAYSYIGFNEELNYVQSTARSMSIIGSVKFSL